MIENLDQNQILFITTAMAFSAVVTGFMAGFFGIGGGLIMVPILFYLFGFAGIEKDFIMHLALGTSFSIIIPTSIISTMTHMKFKAVDFEIVKTFGVFVAIGVIFGTIFAVNLKTSSLVLFFSIMTMLFALYFLTAKEKINPKPKNRIDAKKENGTKKLLQEFGIDQLTDSYPDEISGGQAQRVNLARTLIVNPKVLLLDEPFGALDPSTRTYLQDWLLDIKSSRDLTIVLVTHDVEEALKLADRIIIMSAGPGTFVESWDLRSVDSTDESSKNTIKKQILDNYQGSIQNSSTQINKSTDIEEAIEILEPIQS